MFKKYIDIDPCCGEQVRLERNAAVEEVRVVRREADRLAGERDRAEQEAELLRRHRNTAAPSYNNVGCAAFSSTHHNSGKLFCVFYLLIKLVSLLEIWRNKTNHQTSAREPKEKRQNLVYIIYQST